MSVRLWAICLSFSLALPGVTSAVTPPPLSAADATLEPHLGPAWAGAIHGAATVSAGGNASYRLPLELPPGINGLAPDLALHYNSNVQNGELGLGWFLGGLSTSRITRCPQTLSANGAIHAVDFSQGDRFCLGWSAVDGRVG